MHSLVMHQTSVASEPQTLIREHCPLVGQEGCTFPGAFSISYKSCIWQCEPYHTYIYHPGYTTDCISPLIACFAPPQHKTWLRACEKAPPANVYKYARGGLPRRAYIYARGGLPRRAYIYARGGQRVKRLVYV